MADRPTTITYDAFQMMCDRRDKWKARAEEAEKALLEAGLIGSEKHKRNLKRKADSQEKMKEFYRTKWDEEKQRADGYMALLKKARIDLAVTQFDLNHLRNFFSPVPFSNIKKQKED